MTKHLNNAKSIGTVTLCSTIPYSIAIACDRFPKGFEVKITKEQFCELYLLPTVMLIFLLDYCHDSSQQAGQHDSTVPIG
jgi:hypothetical protein